MLRSIAALTSLPPRNQSGSRPRNHHTSKRTSPQRPNSPQGRFTECFSTCLRLALIGSAVVLATRLCNGSPIPTQADRQPKSNWTTPDAPCAKFDDLRKQVIGDIGVNIDVAEPWAGGFRRALRFWNTVLTANLHEEADLNACSVRIIEGGPGILRTGIAARSQFTERANFRGKIAVSPIAAKQLNSAEIYAAAVHELGHLLGLKHNPSGHSIMYFLGVDGTEVLDGEDIQDLSSRHELRPAILEKPWRLIPLCAPTTCEAETYAAVLR